MSSSTPSTSTQYYDSGMTALAESNVSRAVLDFIKAIEQNPLNADAYCGLGDAYLIQGQFDRAIANLSLAIAIQPASSHAHASSWICSRS